MRKLLSMMLALMIVFSAAVPVFGTEETAPSVTDFTDVEEGRYYYDGVDYAVKNELMNGLSETVFGPDRTMTRGMFVTVLFRLSGDEAPTDVELAFTDLREGAYYEDAVKWGVSKEIVTGTTDTTFAPDMDITREMMCVLMVRYANYKGYEMPERFDSEITPEWLMIGQMLWGVENPYPFEESEFYFGDTVSIREYALSAVYSCYDVGVINGVSATEFRPQGNATRGQVATVLMRFIRNVAATAETETNGNTETVTYTDLFGEVFATEVVTYAEDGVTVLKRVYTNGEFVQTSEWEYDDEGALKSWYTEDTDGNREEKTIDPETGAIRYENSAGANYVSLFGENGLEQVISTSVEETTDPEATYTTELKYSYEYGEAGELISVLLTTTVTYDDGENEEQLSTEFKVNYTYDEEGNSNGWNMDYEITEGATVAVSCTYPVERDQYTLVLDAALGEDGETESGTITVVLDQKTEIITVTLVNPDSTTETETITFDEFFAEYVA